MTFRFVCLFALLAIFVVITSSAGMAQGHNGFCDRADSTAATQACLKRHLDSGQRRLNKVYQKLLDQLEGEKKEKLIALQKTWIEYRDAECDWESDQSETASIQKLNETSCLARVTEDRADLLSVLYNDGIVSDEPREYGSFPRWMNVVAKDAPSVAWFYGGRRSVDLNCDGEDEQLMKGVDAKGASYFTIVQNPAIGRPKSQRFAFTEGKGCFEGIQFTPIVKDKASESDVCESHVQIKAKDCEGQTIVWAGKKFMLTTQDDVKKNKEDKKDK